MNILSLVFDEAPESSWVELGTLEHRIWTPASQISELDASSLKTTFGSLNDLFFGPALRNTPNGMTKSDVLGSRVLWADIDNPVAPKCILPPSLVINSGYGWHYYWLLEDWELNIERIENANKILAELVSGDSCWNANRLLRVPGTFNTKSSQEVRECRLQFVTPVTYPIEDCIAISEVSDVVRRRILSGSRKSFHSRSERDWNVIRELVRCSIGIETIRTIFHYNEVGDKFREEEERGNDYLERTIEKSRTVTKSKAERSIIERGDGYYVVTGKSIRRISTFTFEPECLWQGDVLDTTRTDSLRGTVLANGFTWTGVVFSRTAFTSRNALDRECAVAAWQFLGRDDDVRLLLPYLMGKLQAKGLPRVQTSSVVGVRIFNQRHWCVGEVSSLNADELYGVGSSPLVYSLPKREHPSLMFHTEGLRVDSGLLQHIGELLPMLNTDETIWPIIGWYMASAYKESLEICGLRFPVLNAYGTKGSGKSTTILRVMLPLVGVHEPKSYDCKTTRFVVTSLLGSSTTVPIAFSEYRATSAESFLRYILLAYDTGHDPRGRADQTTQDYPLRAPFSIDGEDLLADAAVRERIIAVNFRPSAVAEGTEAWYTYKEFQSLTQSELVSQWATAYQRFALRELDSGAIPSRVTEASKLLYEKFPQQLPDRVRNNLTVVWIGVMQFCRFTEHELPPVTVLQSVLDAIVSSKFGRSLNTVDEFLEYVSNHKSGIAHREIDSILWFQLAPALEQWVVQRRRSGLSALGRDAIVVQLSECDYVTIPKIVDGRWMYGLNLQLAFSKGLDIRNELPNVKLGTDSLGKETE